MEWIRQGEVSFPRTPGELDSVRAWRPWVLEEEDATLRMWYTGSDGTTSRILTAGRPPGGVNGQRVRDYPQVSIRVPPKLHAQLATLTRQTGMSRLEIFIEAIDCFEHSLRRSRRTRLDAPRDHQ